MSSGNRERQPPLSLRFEHRRLWPDFQRELGVNQTGAAIILDICSVNGAVSYSRTARHYDRPERYRNPLYTFRRVVGQIDYLDQLGWVEHDRRRPGERGLQSTIQATGELRDICEDIVGDQPLLMAKPAEVILLRDEHKNLIDYPETRDLDRLRRRLERINEAIGAVMTDPHITAPMVRIFNRTMKRGGRFYARGASWQNLKSEARKNLSISGEPVVELDYASLHPAILYGEAGAPMPRDCYEIYGWPRALVKVAMLTLINAPKIHQARLAIAHSDRMATIAQPGSQSALEKADRLIADIKRIHAPIAASFHSDAGAKLMGIDAVMAETVMNTMILKKGIIVLPIHDSFLVPASKREELLAAMLEAAHQAGVYSIEVNEK